MQKICKLCGQSFESKGRRQICYRDHYKTCCICGSQFLIRRSYLNQKTCSKTCANILSKQNREKTSLELYGVKNAGGTKESLNQAK